MKLLIEYSWFGWLPHFPFAPHCWHEWKWNPQSAINKLSNWWSKGPLLTWGWEVSSLRPSTWSQVPQALTKASPLASQLYNTITVTTVTSLLYKSNMPQTHRKCSTILASQVHLTHNWSPRQYHCHHCQDLAIHCNAIAMQCNPMYYNVMKCSVMGLKHLLTRLS